MGINYTYLFCKDKDKVDIIIDDFFVFVGCFFLSTLIKNLCNQV